jgi:type II secretory pathway predicted ATPase ExeA
MKEGFLGRGPLNPPNDPFADHPNPAYYVARDASDGAFADLLECVGRPDLPAALLAPPGLGKTLLLRMLANRLPPALRGVYVPNPVLSPAELCAWTLGCLGSPPWPDPISVLGAYADHLAERGGALVWLVDDAHSLPEETARWLGHVLARARGALRLVIAAVEDERAKSLPALGPMVRIDALAQPMHPGETARYVFGRLDRASGASTKRAAGIEADLRARCQAALDAIHEQSAGVPREVSVALSALFARWDAGLRDGAQPALYEAR